MEKDIVKLVVLNGEDIGYWKNRTRNYLLSQGCATWEIIQIFSQKPEESLDDCFARFESIVSNLRACDHLAYTNNERAK
jgi:hypothetical protein